MEKDIIEKSKTQIKKEAEELQKLGEKLARLSSQQLERMELPDDLRNALIEADSIKSKNARRRHMQFIGALMRTVDPEPINHALLQIDFDLPFESKVEKKAGMWMKKLLTQDQAGVEEFINICPEIERQRLRQLIRNIKKEKTPGKSLKALEQLVISNME